MKSVMSNQLDRLKSKVMHACVAGKMRARLSMASAVLMLSACAPAWSQITVSVGLPSVSIGINVPAYPELIPVPGYPVYYDPRLDSNLFFYDGLYWVYAQDNWYVSSWYDGPWELVDPGMVPDFILRIPVRYYRVPPAYFFGWDHDAAPRWGEHWGRNWDDRRRGWDHWDRASIPERAPLPSYQRNYSHSHYPRIEQQQTLRDRNYHFQPREDVDRRHFEQPPRPAREPNRAPTEYKRPEMPHSDVRRGNPPSTADHPPGTEPRKLPARPSTDATDGQRSQPDRRTPDSHRGNAPSTADHPSVLQRPKSPQSPGGDSANGQRSQRDRRPPQQGNSRAQPAQQGHQSQGSPTPGSQPPGAQGDRRHD